MVWSIISEGGVTELELVKYLSLLSRVFSGNLEVSLPVVLCSTITVGKSVYFPKEDDWRGRVDVLEIGGTHFFCQSVGHCSMGVYERLDFGLW